MFFSFDYHKTKFRPNSIRRIVFQHNFDIVSHFAVGTLRIAKPEADDLSLCFVSGLPAVFDKSRRHTSKQVRTIRVRQKT